MDGTGHADVGGETMKILITGERGFIGSSLVRAFQTGILHAHHAIADVTEIIHPPCNLIDLDQWTDKIKLDRIYHLASTPSPFKYKKKPLYVMMSNVQGTFNILELAKRTGARVLFTSTVDVDKQYPSNDSRACYVDSKKCAEDLCHLYRDTVDVRIARLYSTYGPGMMPDDGRVIPEFIKLALQNKPISIYGDGSQMDSFCYITDMLQALYRFMEAEDPTKEMELGNPLLTGAYGLTTIIDLAKMIISICRSDSTISHISYNGFNKFRVPNIAIAKRELGGWIPMVGLGEGLEKTVHAMKEVLQ
jgi:UDP-glucuronate decarboxylase